jgi:hypothetical protein
MLLSCSRQNTFRPTPDYVRDQQRLGVLTIARRGTEKADAELDNVEVDFVSQPTERPQSSAESWTIC